MFRTLIMFDLVVIVEERELVSATIGTIDGGGIQVRHFVIWAAL